MNSWRDSLLHYKHKGGVSTLMEFPDKILPLCPQ